MTPPSLVCFVLKQYSDYDLFKSLFCMKNTFTSAAMKLHGVPRYQESRYKIITVDGHSATYFTQRTVYTFFDPCVNQARYKHKI